LIVTAFQTVPVLAQDYGEASRGSALASQVCATCHGIRHGENSPNPLAPPFAVIAATRGMSETALNVALQSPHRVMPNIMLEPQERADIIAYILTLKPN
jgi:mono/diheme cytochrome c family protein